MSGVFCYIRSGGGELAKEVALRMGERMRHLPHQQFEVGAISPSVAIGRLHIGLLNREMQPVRSADGKVHLCLCGEFYYQDQRRRSLELEGRLSADADDSQLALALFLRDGAAGLTELDGAFTCAVWDGRERSIWLINDRYGLYPHYYAHIGGTLAFGPELKGLIATPHVTYRLDETAIAEYVRFQQLLGDRTWLENVRLLPPASLLQYVPEIDRLNLQRYWDWDRIGEQPGIGFIEAVEAARDLFQRAIDAMLAPPLRPGIFLSGGMDGRIILAFAADRVPLQTLTFGAPGSRDVIYGARLARWAGVPHRWFPFTDGRWVLEYHALHLALTEGMHSWMHGHGISTLAEARGLMDVNLSGWDGGTTMGAFAVLENHTADRYYRHPPDEVSLTERLFAGFCRDVTWPGMSEGEAAAVFSGAGRERLRDRAFESLCAEVARTAHYRAEHRVDYFVLQQLIRRSLQNQIVTQRSTIEVRCPYFDYRFVEFMYALPDHVRARPDFRRALLTRRMPQLALVPYEKDNRLPHSNCLLRETDGLARRGAAWLNRRVKWLFPDRTRLYANYEQYLRTDLRAWAEDILFDRRTLERGLFNEAAIRSLWGQHLAGDQLWTIGKVAPLITIELIIRQLNDEPLLTNDAAAHH